MEPVIDGVEGLDAEWLSAALGQHVRVVATEPIGAGQMGSSWRVTLDTDEFGPPSVVAKLAAGDDAARSIMSMGFRKEVSFYTELASTLRVRMPASFYGAISDDGRSFTLLLEDVAPARPGVQAESCTLEQATGAVRNLAALHASRWNDPTLRELEFLSPMEPGIAELFAAALPPATEEFIDRYDGQLGDHDAATLRTVAERIGPWLLDRAEPFAVVHGDYRLDNLMFAPDGEVIALDWQSVGVGAPGRDLAYFIGTAFDASERQQHEPDLVDAYHAALLGLGVNGYDTGQCDEDYRAGHLQGPLITVLGAIHATAGRTDSADRMFIAMATRSCAAIRDLGALELIR